MGVVVRTGGVYLVYVILFMLVVSLLYVAIIVCLVFIFRVWYVRLYVSSV